MKFLTGIKKNSPGDGIASAILSFEKHYGVHLTVHDCHGVLYHPDGTPFLKGRNIHCHPYCIGGRFERDGWNRRCHEECALHVTAIAEKSLRPFVHSCWKAVTELVIPVARNGRLSLLIYAGVFRSPDSEPPDFVPASLRSIWKEMPEADEELFKEILPGLQLLGQGIWHFLEEYRGKGGEPSSRREIVLRYLDEHAHEEISLAELAAHLNLSVTYTCHLVKYHFGSSFNKLLLRERILRAENLLISSDMPIKAVASAVGLRNEFYFNRLFTREKGIPPGVFRRKSGL